jgi:hypothetical protein
MTMRDEELVILYLISGIAECGGQTNYMRYHARCSTLVQRNEQKWPRSSMHSGPREVALSTHELLRHEQDTSPWSCFIIPPELGPVHAKSLR